jgi:hypothetical protein
MKMGDQGRSSAYNCAAMVILALLMSMAVAVQAATHIVGTSTNEWEEPGQGNSLNSSYYQDWANSQSFAAGDILIFTYSASVHDVLQVTSSSYASCTTSSPIKTYDSGNDSISITAGTTYFICGTPTHCPAGQKVTITTTNSTATNSTSSSPPPPPPSGSSAAFRHGTSYTPPAFAAIVFALLSALAS